MVLFFAVCDDWRVVTSFSSKRYAIFGAGKCRSVIAHKGMAHAANGYVRYGGTNEHLGSCAR